MQLVVDFAALTLLNLAPLLTAIRLARDEKVSSISDGQVKAQTKPTGRRRRARLFAQLLPCESAALNLSHDAAHLLSALISLDLVQFAERLSAKRLRSGRLM